MNYIKKATMYLLGAFKGNERVKEFKDDMIGGFIDWIEPIFLKDDEIMKKKISERNEAAVEYKLETMMQGEKFKKELTDWIKKLEASKVKRKNIVEETEVEAEEDIKVGDKSVSNTNSYDEKNIVSKSKFKTIGGFTVGDG